MSLKYATLYDGQYPRAKCYVISYPITNPGICSIIHKVLSYKAFPGLNKL